MYFPVEVNTVLKWKWKYRLGLPQEKNIEPTSRVLSCRSKYCIKMEMNISSRTSAGELTYKLNSSFSSTWTNWKKKKLRILPSSGLCEKESYFNKITDQSLTFAETNWLIITSSSVIVLLECDSFIKSWICEILISLRNDVRSWTKQNINLRYKVFSSCLNKSLPRRQDAHQMLVKNRGSTYNKPVVIFLWLFFEDLNSLS